MNKIKHSGGGSAEVTVIAYARIISVAPKSQLGFGPSQNKNVRFVILMKFKLAKGSDLWASGRLNIEFRQDTETLIAIEKERTIKAHNIFRN